VLVDTPLLALIGVALSVVLSSRVNDPRAAQQFSAVLVVPVLGLLFGQVAGVIVLGPGLALGIAVVLAIIAAGADLAREAIPMCRSERVAGIEPALQLWKSRLRPLQHTRTGATPTVRSVPVTVRTNDIALRDLGEDGFGTSATDHFGDRVAFLSSLSMVEVHDIEEKSSAAVKARNVAKFGQQVCVRLPVRALLFDSG
jgi:hypothetical protein